MQTFSTYCEKYTHEKNIILDAQQQAVINELQKIGEALLLEQKKRKNMLCFLRPQQKIKGLYLWGNVGVGKTLLMDCFYSWLPLEQKRRMHFHAFMRFIHLSLKKQEGKKDPLKIIAQELASETIILCFDELFVVEIVDAVILAALFDALINAGMTLIFTSNAAPDDLYKRGLLRERFLPAIALIKANAIIKHLDTKIDYRLRHLKEAGVFFLSTDPATSQSMENIFKELAQHDPVSHQPLHMNDREIAATKHTHQVVWFDFNVLCHIPRSDKDYLAIAERFSTIFISNIPVIQAKEVDTIILFIRLIDILYDSHTRLVFSAAATADQLYSDGPYHALYARTCSRLIEMQSVGYFIS